jgi:hypothetical protein
MIWMGLRRYFAPSLVAACASSAMAGLATHASVLYGNGVPAGQEVFAGPLAAAEAGYGPEGHPGWFHGTASAHASYGLLSAQTQVAAQGAAFTLNRGLAEASFSDLLTISGTIGDGFVVYTYALTGSAAGEADAHLFLRHASDPDEELAGEVVASAVFDSLPHHFTFGQPFLTGASILVAASLGEGESGAAWADFSAGAALTHIRVFDAQMRPIDGWTIDSQSGTSYPVPAPGTGLLFLGAAMGRQRRRFATSTLTSSHTSWGTGEDRS